MSKQELKHFERLNISTLPISVIKNMIKTNITNTIGCWDAEHYIEKQTFHIIGPAGVGKTQICYQICNELTKELFPEGDNTFNIIKINAPVLSRDDFICPFPVIDNGNTSFKMLYSDFVPKMIESKGSYGLFVIDEFARGDHALQQLMWQVQNECRLHLYDFPKGWFVVTIDNPDDQEYSMDYIDDAAGLRRTLHVFTEVSVVEFIKYAMTTNFHPIIIEFIQTHPDYLYDFKSQKLGAVYANPASWERVSNILWGYELNGGIKSNISMIEDLCAGLLNSSKTRLLIAFIKDQKDISPVDIVFNYGSVRKDIIKLLKDQDNARLGQIMTSFTTYLTTSYPDIGKNEKKNIVEFLTSIPIDTAAVFITILAKFDRSSKEFRFMNKIHKDLLNSSRDYKTEFYDNLTAAADEAQSVR